MACLKRAHWVVNLKLATYVRRADGTKEADVPLIRHEDGDSEFISEDGKKMIARMRAGDMSLPDDWLMRRQWSHDLLSMVLENNTFPPRTTSTRVHSPFSGKTEILEEKPSLPPSGRICRLAQPEEPNPKGIPLGASDDPIAAVPLIQVKKEPAETFSKLKRKATTQVIELDTPSPQRARSVQGFEAEEEDHFPGVGEAADVP